MSPSSASNLADPFLREASRLAAFTPPFAFSAFFSPEDTLLCVCAAEDALARLDEKQIRMTELTTGSGLVGLHMLLRSRNTSLVGLDVDPSAIDVATSNAAHLGLSDRAVFARADLWSASTLDILHEFAPHLIICNPPYIPEPQGQRLDIEAGSGADGTAHLIRTLEIAAEIKPQSLALSWCSVSDPAKVLSAAARAGYELDSLFIVVIADGEYSRLVHGYLQSLPHAYINESADTIALVAPDGSASFAYLLMAGAFSRVSDPVNHADFVEGVCQRFASRGVDGALSNGAPIPTKTWILNRWDELELRAILHGRHTDENTRRR